MTPMAGNHTTERRRAPGWRPGPDARQVLATALFARTDVLGFERMEYELTLDAIELGLAPPCQQCWSFHAKSVSLVGARGFEPPTSSSRTMRATKLRHAPTEVARRGPSRNYSKRLPGGSR